MRRVTLLFATLFLTPPGAPADDRPVRDKVREVERHMKQVIDDAEASVVAIAVSQNPRYPGRFDPANPGRLGGYIVPQPLLNFGGGGGGAFDPKLDLSDANNLTDHPFGSGVVLDVDGLILTNYHLIEGARKIYVRAAGGKGAYADIHAADARSDLAVLKLLSPLPGLKPMKIAEARISTGPGGEKPTVARGMWLVSLGHPQGAGFADGAPSASWGILSNVRRRGALGTQDDSRYKPLSQLGALLQTDARLTLGSAGSPLLNLDGEMVGLSTPIAAITGAETAGGFAIPMDQNYRRIVATLKQGKEVEYGFLGVGLDQGNVGPKQLENGLVLSLVSPGGPAAEAGLQGGRGGGGGDSILAIDGNPLREQDDLYLYVGAALAGSTVKLTVARQGRRRTVDVTLGKFSHEFPFIASVRPPLVHGLRVDWNTAQQQKGLGSLTIPPCVSVREIDPAGEAAKKLRAFDPDLKGTWLVLNVDGKVPVNPATFYALTGQKASVTMRMLNLAEPDAPRDITLP